MPSKTTVKSRPSLSTSSEMPERSIESSALRASATVSAEASKDSAAVRTPSKDSRNVPPTAAGSIAIK